jgi:asparagine synthase (glutamine-hydrolysing)
MCGICGVWNYADNAPVDRGLLAAMRDTLAHRGPDDVGLHVSADGGLGLGFRRLSIIDLSPAGHQPMGNEDGSVWIVFNGEIYNFKDLRPQVEARGHSLRSRTDTEVVLHLFEDRDLAAFAQLEGMFGLALWDDRARRLVLARDRVGKKPLYYFDDGKRLLFSSELKGILVDTSVPRDLDWTALGEYLALGYVPGPRTIYKGICKLPPGHVLVHQDGRARLERYWDWLPAFGGMDGASPEEEWSGRLRASLEAAVRKRLVSDVPLGAFLSGGVDSSAVVALMATAGNRPVKTFSIGFAEEQANELPYARMVAERYATEHHEIIVAPDAPRDVLPLLAGQYDEPFADSSAVPTYYVCRAARAEVTVALSGDGGDEGCAGYTRYGLGLEERWADSLPGAARALLGATARSLPTGYRGQERLRRLSLGPAERYAALMRQMGPARMTSLLKPEAARQVAGGDAGVVSRAMRDAEGLDLLSRMQYSDVRTYLPDDILVKVDRASMLNSLEVRSPFLDHTFLELMAAVPPHLRWNAGSGKQLLKRALRGLVPDPVLDRPKMGFGIPLADWVRGGLASYAEEVFSDPSARARGIVDTEALLVQLRRYRDGSGHNELTALWPFLMLEVWSQSVAAGSFA